MHPLVIVALIAGFIFLWCFVSFLLSRFGGWSKLAVQFRATTPPQGTGFHMVGGFVGWVQYRAVLTVYVSDEGIYLAVFPLFRFGHPPLFIPWTQCIGLTPEKWFWFDLVKIPVGQPTLATMWLQSSVIPKDRVDESRSAK